MPLSSNQYLETGFTTQYYTILSWLHQIKGVSLCGISTSFTGGFKGDLRTLGISG